MAVRLTGKEQRVLRDFVDVVEEMMLEMDAESVGRIADHVGEHGTDGDGGVREDGTVLECLRLIVDEMGRD
jgi:hypothetical protein